MAPPKFVPSLSTHPRCILPALAIAAMAACAVSASADSLPIAPGAELKLAADGFRFTEGPAADRHGDVYFTDQPNNRILKWTAATGEVATFLEPSGRANGMAFDPGGFLITCADENGRLERVDTATGERTTLADHFEGKTLNGPNDVWVRPDGGMYLTDPFYKRDYWEGRDAPDQEKERVYFLAKGATRLVVVEDRLEKPNGIIGTPDGKRLYVADIGGGKTWQYQINGDGTLAGRELFCELGSDGMTLDSAGNVYLTGKGVTVYAPDGRKLGAIPVPRGWTANVTFAGPEGKTLFITAMDAVFTLEMSVAGAGR